MSLVTIIFIYLVVWWTTLFAILPLGVRSHWEEGISTPGGGDPSSPVDPKLKRKFFTTSWVAALVTGIFCLVIQFHLIHLPQLPGAG
jgi:predicted secreted protein